jgi:NMD protein affecting ribosome stability and mRNA decay
MVSKRICPKCGGPKWVESKLCARCFNNAPKPEVYICPKCGGKKAWQSKQCSDCWVTERNAARKK